MKKLIISVLTFALLLSLAACASDKPNPIDTPSPSPSETDSLPPDQIVDDDTAVIDIPPNESGGEESSSDVQDPTDDTASSETDSSLPARTFSNDDKEQVSTTVADLMNQETGLDNAKVYEVNPSDGYNCIVTVGYVSTEDEVESICLVDYDMHYEDGIWQKSASYKKGDFEAQYYDVLTDADGNLQVSPKK